MALSAKFPLYCVCGNVHTFTIKHTHDFYCGFFFSMISPYFQVMIMIIQYFFRPHFSLKDDSSPLSFQVLIMR